MFFLCKSWHDRLGECRGRKRLVYSVFVFKRVQDLLQQIDKWSDATQPCSEGESDNSNAVDTLAAHGALSVGVDLSWAGVLRQEKGPNGRSRGEGTWQVE